ncbi:MAG: hypothetical protein WD872_02955 [Pirellulaceae bacterium]
MDTISRNVDDLADPDRAALEHVLGRPLEADQQVLITVVRKGEEAALTTFSARARILKTLDRTSQRAAAVGLSPAVADDLVAEAMAAIRPRPGSP